MARTRRAILLIPNQTLLGSGVRTGIAVAPERVATIVTVKRTATAVVPVPVGAIGVTPAAIV